ncbi:MAG: protein BatD, partial [Akkermansiaceae bacterium]|nr:protein BatD [Akkermansiaceae bacterium]
VNVGDPITLNIALSGPAFLEPVDLPPLDRQESLTRDFKVPTEIEEGSVDGNFKVFTQTVRALRDDVKAVPPIE